LGPVGTVTSARPLLGVGSSTAADSTQQSHARHGDP
jgi:hypothetical protein